MYYPITSSNNKNDRQSSNSNNHSQSRNEFSQSSEVSGIPPPPRTERVLTAGVRPKQRLTGVGNIILDGTTNVTGILTQTDLYYPYQNWLLNSGDVDVETLLNIPYDINYAAWGGQAAIGALKATISAIWEVMEKDQFVRAHPVMSTDPAQQKIEIDYFQNQINKHYKAIASHMFTAITDGLQLSLYVLESGEYAIGGIIIDTTTATTGIGPIMMVTGFTTGITGFIQWRKGKRRLESIQKAEDNRPISRISTDSVRASRKIARYMLPLLQLHKANTKIKNGNETMLTGGIEFFAGSGFLALSLLVATGLITAPFSAGLTIIPVVACVSTAAIVGGRHLKKRINLAKSEKNLQDKLIQSEEKVKILDQVIDKLSMEILSAQSYISALIKELSELEQLIKEPNLRADFLRGEIYILQTRIAQNENRISSLQAERHQAATDVEKISADWFFTHPDVILEELLNDLCYPDKPHHADQIKEILRHYCLAQHQGKFDQAKFEETCDLLKALWTSGDPKSQENAKFIYRKFLGFPKESFVPLSEEKRKKIYANLSPEEINIMGEPQTTYF